jgi:predicted 2-oxoglutarate/Fe(II)-dependent dioxygenase YbiX
MPVDDGRVQIVTYDDVGAEGVHGKKPEAADEIQVSEGARTQGEQIAKVEKLEQAPSQDAQNELFQTIFDELAQINNEKLFEEASVPHTTRLVW